MEGITEQRSLITETKWLPVPERAILPLMNMSIWNEGAHVVKHTCKNSLFYLDTHVHTQEDL